MLLKRCKVVISQNIDQINLDIVKNCELSGIDPKNVTLIGASKSQSVEKIQEAHLAGLNHFGENYLQEAEEKIQILDERITWHFIGSLQSRKAKRISEIFDWVHTVDNIKVARKLNDCRPELKGPLNVCIQLNIDSEKTKSGLYEESLENLIDQTLELKKIKIRGLMVIPKPRETEEEQIKVFRKVSLINATLIEKGFEFDTLSMGMTTDYAAAIQEGATMIRVGTGIFGKRK